MNGELLKFLKHEVIKPAIESTPMITYGIVTGKGRQLEGIETVNVRVVYGNPDAPSHFNGNGELIKNVPVVLPGSGAVSINIKDGDRVIIGFINGDQNAPYILSAPKTTAAKASSGVGGIPIDANEEALSLGTADASFASKDLATIKTSGDFTNLINSIYKNINDSTMEPTWDPSCRVYIDIAHDDSDPGATTESSFPERDINLIMGTKLKEFLIGAGAHKDSIKTSRTYTDSLDYEAIVKNIYSFNPTVVIGLHSGHPGGDTTLGIDKGISAFALGTGDKQNKLAGNIKDVFSNKFANSINKITLNSESSGSKMCNALIANANYAKNPAPYLEFYYFNLTIEQVSHIDTVSEIYDVALALANSICKTVGSKEIKVSSFGSDLIKTIIDIIFGNETSGGYAKANNDYKGLFSVGRAQWTSDRAKNILKRIREKNESAWNSLRSNLRDEIYSSTSWAHKTATQDEINSTITFLGCSGSQQAQDEQMNIDVTAYINNAKSRGLTDSKAIAYMCDIEHQYGTGGCNTYYASMGLNNPSLDQLYEAVMKTNGGKTYKNRRENTYKILKKASI